MNKITAKLINGPCAGVLRIPEAAKNSPQLTIRIEWGCFGEIGSYLAAYNRVPGDDPLFEFNEDDSASLG